MGEERGEFPCLVQSRTEQTRDLLDNTVTSKEGIVGLGWGREGEGEGGRGEGEGEGNREGRGRGRGGGGV